MEQGRASVRAFSTIAVVLFIVGALIAGYYIGYYQHRQGSLTRLRSRAINQIAERLEARFEAIDAPRTSTSKSCRKPPSAADFLLVREGKKSKAPILFTHFGFGVRQQIAGNDPYLVTSLWRKDDAKKVGETVCELRAHLKKMFSASITRDLFDDYALVLLPENTVLYQHRPQTTGKLTTLSTLLKQRKDCPSGQLFSPPKQTTAASTPASTEVPVGRFCVSQHGEDYQLFTQIFAAQQVGPSEPARNNGLIGGTGNNRSIQTNEEKEPPRLLVVGFLKQSRLIGEARGVSSTWLQILVLLLLTAILAAPFLKLRFVGERERLRARDVYLAVLAGIVGAGLLTISVMSTYSQRSYSSKLDEKLKTFADSMSRNFDAELGSALHEICRHTGFEKLDRKKVIYRNFSNLLLIGEDGRPSGGYKLCASNGENGNCDGDAEIVPLATTPVLDLADRQYFIRAKEGKNSNLWNLNGKRFVAASLQSRASGEKTAAVAVPYGVTCDGRSDCADKEWVGREDVQKACRKKAKVVVLAGRLRSIIEPVVPFGFGFAIVNDDGEVLFHSDSTRNTDENMFVEAEEKDALRALMAARLADHLDVSYEGSDHRFYVRELSGVPWYLMTFRNKDVWREIDFGISGLAALNFIGYVLFLLALFVVARIGGWLPRRYRAEWLWPQPDSRVRYRVAAVALLALSLATIGAATSEAFGRYSAFLMILPPLLGIRFAHIAFRQPKDANPPSNFTGYPIGYYILLFVLLLVVAITPTFVAYNDAYAIGMKSLLQRQEEHLLRSLRSRSTEDRDSLLCSERPNPNDWYENLYGTVEGRRVGKTSCILSMNEKLAGRRSKSKSKDWSCADDGPPAKGFVPVSLALTLIELLPRTFGNQVALFRDCLHNGANDKSWGLIAEKDGHLTYTNCGLPRMRRLDSVKEWFRVSAAIDPLPLPRDYLHLVLIVGGLSLMLGVTCWTANRIFLVRAETESTYDGLEDAQRAYTSNPKVAWESCSEDERLVLFQLAEENFVNPNRWREIRRLRRAGMLRRDPALSLDTDLKRYVLAALPEKKVRELEQGGRPSVWVELRTPLLALSLLIAGFFLLTQPDVFNSAVAIATALAGALAFVPRILASFGGSEKKPEK